MPRQDVPYGGAICRLRERIAEIFDKLGEKLHTINGVPGDGDGNVKIVSGSSAVVITNDPTQNEIAVSLDTSQLPAASVSSVNGQTGAVALTADDVPSDNGDVQTDLDNLAAADVTLQGNINAEALARQGADSTLQTNINAVSASIPGAAAAAVAADPTVAYVASEINNKVDKITSGSSLKAYTHTGATQGETSIVDGTTANSIGIRDANGRMQAADPASGATDKTLVTANWVSQTGSGAPNNLIHTTGVESIDTIKNGIVRKSVFIRVATSQEQSQNLHWFKILDVQQNFKLKMEAYSRYGYWNIVVAGSNTLQTNAVISKVGQWINLSNRLKACLNSTTGRWEIWLDSPSGNSGGGMTVNVEADPMAGSTTNPNFAVLNVNAAGAAEPVVGATYTVVNVII